MSCWTVVVKGKLTQEPEHLICAETAEQRCSPSLRWFQPSEEEVG